MKFLGLIKGQGLYASWNEEHNQIRYNLDGQDIAVYDLDVMDPIEDPILFMNNTNANELSAEIKDQIQYIARKIDIEKLKEYERTYSKDTQSTLEELLGIEKGHIVSIAEIDLNEEIESQAQGENKKKDKKRGEKQATRKDIKIKQELKMDAMATDLKTVGQVLKRAGKMPKVEGKEFTKLGIVESDDIKNIDKKAKTNTTRFSFVAIASDGTVVPINLEQDRQEGDNPRDISYNTRAYGQIEQDDVKSRYRIGNNGETLSIKQGTVPGYIEVGYSSHKTVGGDGIEGNKSMDTQLQTDTVVFKTRKDMRQSEFRGYRQAEDKYQEAKDEGESDIKDMKPERKGVSAKGTYKETDGRKETKSHKHKDEEQYEGRVPWDGQGRR